MPPAPTAGNARMQTPQNPPVPCRSVVDFFLRTWLGNVLALIGLLFTVLGVAWTIYTGVLGLRYGALQTCATLYSIGKYSGPCNKTLDAGVTPAPVLRRDVLIRWDTLERWEQADNQLFSNSSRVALPPPVDITLRYVMRHAPMPHPWQHIYTACDKYLDPRNETPETLRLGCAALRNSMQAASVVSADIAALTLDTMIEVNSKISQIAGALDTSRITVVALCVGFMAVITWMVWEVLGRITAFSHMEIVAICVGHWAVGAVLLQYAS
ncbi:hypothetical protein LTR17_022120 [Elasticomyces elasticus]|nr:hypothetical protein LTR17_022120 [Elasticomyces elasticus]